MLPVIHLERIPLPHDLVRAAVERAIVVQTLNGTRNDASLPITLITDSADVARNHIAIDEKDFDDVWGLTWHRPDRKVIWLSPERNGKLVDCTKRPYRKEVGSTLVHELAHAMVGRSRGHNWTFRRMYALLLELVGNDVLGRWVESLSIAAGRPYLIESEVNCVIARYQRTGEYRRPSADSYSDAWSWSGERRSEELAKHLTVVERMKRRVQKLTA